MKPSTRRFLRTLQDAGPSGLHSFQFRAPEYGAHIDAPKRCSEARAAGHNIESRPERWNGHQGRRYIYHPTVEVAGEVRSARDPGGPSATPDAASHHSSLDEQAGGVEEGAPGQLALFPDVGPGHDREVEAA